MLDDVNVDVEANGLVLKLNDGDVLIVDGVDDEVGLYVVVLRVLIFVVDKLSQE